MFSTEFVCKNYSRQRLINYLIFFKVDIDSLIRRRSSYTISNTKSGSASKVLLNYCHNVKLQQKYFKVDMLKSALEINHNKVSNPMLRKDGKNSDQSLRSVHAESAPKLYNKNISQPSFIEVLDEVSKFI